MVCFLIQKRFDKISAVVSYTMRMVWMEFFINETTHHPFYSHIVYFMEEKFLCSEAIKLAIVHLT
jgi:hypothetical protein